ncbi:MAG UNVERIFIED_CONTAM: BrnT family toxin [Microcystis novacekii LVE1205-3]|jgi:uncharacterized DUF497 family protein
MDESFEWDEDKNRLNQQKHDVSFELAQYAFFDPNRVICTRIWLTVKKKIDFTVWGKLMKE